MGNYAASNFSQLGTPSIGSKRVTLNIELGDTLLFGRSKDKPHTAQVLGTDDEGQPTINGMKLLACKIEKTLPDEKQAAPKYMRIATELYKTDKKKALELQRKIRAGTLSSQDLEFRAPGESSLRSSVPGSAMEEWSTYAARQLRGRRTI